MYTRDALEFVRNTEFSSAWHPQCNGGARSELSELSLVKFVIGSARIGLSGARFNRSSLYAASAKLAPKCGIAVAAMDTPPDVKTDLRPWRSQIEALLVGIAMSPVVRRALLDA